MVNLGAIAAACRLIKDKQSKGRTYRGPVNNGVSKDQSLRWVEEGLCQMCGEPEGEEKAICDNCRWNF